MISARSEFEVEAGAGAGFAPVVVMSMPMVPVRVVAPAMIYFNDGFGIGFFHRADGADRVCC